MEDKLMKIKKILEKEYGITMEEEDNKPYEENSNILFNAYVDQEYEKDFFDHKSFVAQTFLFKRKHSAKMRR